VKAEAKAKAAAKAVKKQGKQDQIERVVGFETEAMANEDHMDAMPQPNFALGFHTCVESEDLEVDEPNADGHTYVPGETDPDDESDDDVTSAEVTPIPARKKKTPKIVCKISRHTII
jgi:hypothetical protein